MELSLYDMVWGDILEPGHSAHGGRLHRNSLLCKVFKAALASGAF